MNRSKPFPTTTFLLAPLLGLALACGGGGGGTSAPAGPDVYVAGSSQDSAGVSVPGYWKNGSWTSLTPLRAGFSANCKAIVVQ